MCSMPSCSSSPLAWPFTTVENPVAGSWGPLSWIVRSRDPLVLIVLYGTVNRETAYRLGEAVPPRDKSGQHLIVDLVGLRWCGRVGLSLFCRWQKDVTATGGSLHLVAVPAAMRHMITLTGLRHVLPLAADQSEAVTALARRRVSASRCRRVPGP